MSNPSGTPEWLEQHVRSGGANPPKQSEENNPASKVSGGETSAGPPIRIAGERKSPPVQPVLGAEVTRVPRVRYYRKAFTWRVYPLVVRLTDQQGKPDAALPQGTEVEVRPFLPGTEVWPRTQTLGGRQQVARFWVMPVAEGRLPDGHVVIQSRCGQPQSIPLPMRVKTGRGWLFRLCIWLTILLPIAFFILRCLPVDYQHLRYTIVDEEGHEFTHHGRFALEAWLNRHYRQAEIVSADARSVQNWLAILLYQAKDVLLSAYDVYEMLLQDNMLTEPAVLAVMLFITMVVAWLTGPKCRNRVGEPIRLTSG